MINNEISFTMIGLEIYPITGTVRCLTLVQFKITINYCNFNNDQHN